MYLDGLDTLDQKIVQLLIENARISYSDIGEKIGISRVAVKAVYDRHKPAENQRCGVLLFRDRDSARLSGTGHADFGPARYGHADLPCDRQG